MYLTMLHRVLCYKIVVTQLNSTQLKFNTMLAERSKHKLKTIIYSKLNTTDTYRNIECNSNKAPLGIKYESIRT